MTDAPPPGDRKSKPQPVSAAASKPGAGTGATDARGVAGRAAAAGDALEGTGRPATAARFGVLTPALRKSADEAETWGRLISMATFLWAPVAGIAALELASSGHKPQETGAAAMGTAALYLAVCALAMYIGYVLRRFAVNMGKVSRERNAAAYVPALTYESIYWRIAGLITVLGLCAGIVLAVQTVHPPPSRGTGPTLVPGSGVPGDPAVTPPAPWMARLNTAAEAEAEARKGKERMVGEAMALGGVLLLLIASRE